MNIELLCADICMYACYKDRDTIYGALIDVFSSRDALTIIVTLLPQHYNITIFSQFSYVYEL